MKPTQARVQLEAREKVLDAREAELAADSGKDAEQLVARARELDQRELELSARASDSAAELEQLKRELAERDGVAKEAWPALDDRAPRGRADRT